MLFRSRLCHLYRDREGPGVSAQILGRTSRPCPGLHRSPAAPAPGTPARPPPAAQQHEEGRGPWPGPQTVPQPVLGWGGDGPAAGLVARRSPPPPRSCPGWVECPDGAWSVAARTRPCGGRWPACGRNTPNSRKSSTRCDAGRLGAGSLSAARLTTSPPAAHPVPHLAGAVKPDPGGEEKDVRRWACPPPVGCVLGAAEAGDAANQIGRASCRERVSSPV